MSPLPRTLRATWPVLLTVVGCVSAPPATFGVVSLERSNATVLELLIALEARGSHPICLPPAAPARLSVAFHETPWDTAVAAVVAAADLHAQWEDGTLVVETATPTGAELQPRPALEPPPEPVYEELVGSSPRPSLISLDVKDVPLADALREIARQANLEVCVDPNVDVTVTERFREIDAELAIHLIAKTYNCTVGVTASGAYCVGRVHLVRLQFNDVDLATLLDLIARFAGLDLVLDARLQRRLTFDAAHCGLDPTYDLLYPGLVAISETCRISLEVRNGVLLACSRPSGWHDPGLDLDPKHRLDGWDARMTRPRNLLWARNAPARPWFHLMARHLGCFAVIAGDVEGHVSMSERDLPYDHAAYRAAVTHGVWIDFDGSFLRVRNRFSPPRHVPQAPSPRARLTLPDGTQCEVEVQAMVLDRAESTGYGFSDVLIDGEPYRVGDRLRRGETELPVWVHSLAPDAIYLWVEGAPAPVVVPLT